MNNPFFTGEELARLRETESRRPTGIAQYGREWFARQERPLYLFGCGGLVAWIRDALSGLDVHGYLDNDPGKQGTIVNGLRVFRPESVAGRLRTENALVIITLAKAEHVGQVKEQCRILNVDSLDWGVCWPSFEKKAGLSELAENENTIRCQELWDDAESRRVFRDVVRFRTTFDSCDAPAITDPQYFIKEIPATTFRHVVDAGAYDGDTLKALLARHSENVERYYAFEPMPEAGERLEYLAANDPRVAVYKIGISDRCGVAHMTGCSTNSKLGKNDGIQVKLANLDEILGDSPVTFIKMDIEGEEMAALSGASGVIRKNRPTLAICSYHKPDHLWRIPQWIAGLGMGYRLLVRHHSRFLSETVCYALSDRL